MSSTGKPAKKTFLKKFTADQRGSTAIMLALLFPFMVAGLAFGSEYGYFELVKRRLQNASDTAAFAAGTQLRSGLDETGMATAALLVAEESGYYDSTGTLTLASPPVSGAFLGDNSAVHVTLNQSLERWFSKLFVNTPVTLSVDTTVQVNSGRPACVLALDPSADQAVSATGSTDVTLNGCDVASNSISSSAYYQQGNADLHTECISTVGGASVQQPGKLELKGCSQVIENAPVTADPYRGRSEPPNHATMPCEPDNTDWTMNGGTPDSGKKYCGGAVSNQTITVDVDPANPWIVLSGGNWKFNANAEFTGLGVTLFFTQGATLTLNGSAKFTLKAPTSGNFSGLAIFIDRDDATTFKFNGSADATIVGAIYGESASLEVLGSIDVGASGECLQLVAGTIKFSGSSDWDIDCSAAGTESIMAAQSIAIVE